VWLVRFEAQKVLAWRLLLSRFSVLHDDSVRQGISRVKKID
jgi:hypothetical protein